MTLSLQYVHVFAFGIRLTQCPVAYRLFNGKLLKRLISTNNDLSEEIIRYFLLKTIPMYVWSVVPFPSSLGINESNTKIAYFI